jgi:hypothetical protein
MINHRQQVFPLTPGRNLRPRISAHYEKELGLFIQRALKVRDRIYRVATIRIVELKTRNRQLRIVLRRQRQHRITM